MLHWTLISAFDQRLLQEIRSLWLAHPQRNPFVAPSFLEVMGTSAERHGEIPLLAVARFSNATLAAVWPLLLDRGVLRFLQHAFSDQRTCLSHAELTVSQVASGLAYAVRETSPTESKQIKVVLQIITASTIRKNRHKQPKSPGFNSVVTWAFGSKPACVASLPALSTVSTRSTGTGAFEITQIVWRASLAMCSKSARMERSWTRGAKNSATRTNGAGTRLQRRPATALQRRGRSFAMCSQAGAGTTCWFASRSD